MGKGKVKFAVLGCGRISEIHLKAIKNAPNAELAAVCDIVEEKAKQAAIANGLDRWYTNLDDMLAKEDIDVVNICTPSGMHSEHAIAVARTGRHVLCEKPLDVTREKMEDMIDECKRSGVLLGGIFQRRTSSAANNTKKAIEGGKLGSLILADASLKYYRSQEYYDGDPWRGTWELDGGGALMNQGIHGIDLIQWMMGGIDSVYANCATLARKIEVEDTAVILVKFKNGALGTIEGSTAVYPGQDTIFSIQGEKGTISFGDKGFYCWKFMGKDEEAPEVSDSLGGINCGWNDLNFGHTIQVQDMAEAVLENRQPMVTGEDAKKAVEIILAIYESSKTGKEVKL
ncbi:MAG: Gfo/Idh/MocA family oxidoreductase [Xylanivirga thermophila]|uniref:Gfo/Idh/MocA family protein n=1 Tax=Xylanivirga thermophila TaxID=2496273 RepID=UPI00101BD461|nr:Gfo/Idh/MocA family oxidoreductase [Xylanivirga thermophila]